MLQPARRSYRCFLRRQQSSCLSPAVCVADVLSRTTRLTSPSSSPLSTYFIPPRSPPISCRRKPPPASFAFSNSKPGFSSVSACSTRRKTAQSASKRWSSATSTLPPPFHRTLLQSSSFPQPPPPNQAHAPKVSGLQRNRLSLLPLNPSFLMFRSSSEQYEPWRPLQDVGSGAAAADVCAALLQMRDVPTTTTTTSSSSSSSFATPTPSAIRYSPVTHDDSRQPHTLALLPLPNPPLTPPSSAASSANGSSGISHANPAADVLSPQSFEQVRRRLPLRCRLLMFVLVAGAAAYQVACHGSYSDEG